MAKRYYWLKMESDYLSSPKIKKLRKIAGGDTYTIIYLKMQLLSITNGGAIEFQGIEPTLEEELALTLDEDPDNVKITISYLISQNLILDVEDNTFLLPDAANRIGTESESKDRVRAYRERKVIRESIPLKMVKKLSCEQILLPDGNTKFIDNKRYGGNAEYVYELAGCKCEICGETDSKKLVIHHNNGYSNDLEDLFLLCKSCHRKVENGNLKCEKHNRSVTCNMSVTDCNTDIEKERDIEREIEKDTDTEKFNGKKNLPLSTIVDAYHSICVSFPKVRTLTENRKKALNARLRTGYTLEDFKKLFEMTENSNFLKGKNNKNWSADFDWLIKDANMAKVLEGKYENKERSVDSDSDQGYVPSGKFEKYNNGLEL